MYYGVKVVLHADWSINTGRSIPRDWSAKMARCDSENVFCFVFKYDFHAGRLSVFYHFSEHRLLFASRTITNTGYLGRRRHSPQ